MRPFTIILKDHADGEVRDVEIKVDHGGKTTGSYRARTSNIAAKPSRAGLNRASRFDAGESPLPASPVPELG